MVSEDLQQRVLAAHRCFPSGVAVVTTAVDEQPYGLAVNAFSSVSMEPPLVLVCVKTTAKTHDHLYGSDHLGINFLANDQTAIAARFARSGGDKFAEIEWSPGQFAVPVLSGVSAHFEVAVEQRLSAGTHTIFVGRVVDATAMSRPPLVYLGGDFFDGGELRPALRDPAPAQ